MDMEKLVQSSVVGKPTEKVVAVTVLFVMSILIMISGIILGVLSFVNSISFQVMGSSIHGAIFGAVVIFLGFRYFLSVRKLKKEVYKASSNFSWSNFKRTKNKKTI